MSRVVITELITEAVATAANANATLTSWNTASADVDETNVREMGLDRRSMGTRAFTPADGRPTPLIRVGPWTEAAVAILTQVDDGATLIEVGPINQNAANGDQLRVGCSFNYAISAGLGQVASFCLGYASVSGGPWTSIPQTFRRSGLSPGLLGAVPLLPDLGTVIIDHKFTAATSTTLYIALLYTLSAGAGTVTFDNLQLGALQYAR